MPVVVATLTPRAGREDDLEQALRALAGSVHAEEGCELYAVHRSRSRSAPTRFVFIEKWASGDALRAHGQAAHMVEFRQQVADLVEGDTDIVVLDPVPAGDPAKGAL